MKYGLKYKDYFSGDPKFNFNFLTLKRHNDVTFALYTIPYLVELVPSLCANISINRQMSKRLE